MSLGFSTPPFYFIFLIFSSLVKFRMTNDIRKHNFLTLHFFQFERRNQFPNPEMNKKVQFSPRLKSIQHFGFLHKAGEKLKK